MSYINAITKRNQVLVWERNKGKKRVVKRYKAEHFCYVKDEDGEYTSIFKDKLSKRTFKTRSDMSAFLKQNAAQRKHGSGGFETFESDIPTELRTLSATYYNVPAPKLNVTFLDIEVDYDKTVGFSTIAKPYAPINAVALYHNWSNRMVVYAVPPDPEKYKGDPTDLDVVHLTRRMNDIATLPADCNNEVVLCANEKELLHMLMLEIDNSDVISGWNSDFFDVPYIGKRLLIMDGAHELGLSSQEENELIAAKSTNMFNALSFALAGKSKWRDIKRYGADAQMLDLGGRISIDYLDLFRKYEMSERPSYKLESISEEILPSLTKLEYQGSLADLYHNDFPRFCRYNFRDTEILKGFEDKLGYVELANQMVHLSTGLFKHVGGTLKLAELATINFCHHELDKKVNDIRPDDSGDTIKGAFVLIPQVGMHENIGSVDINSLYPSAIRSINISPETLIGQFAHNIKDAQLIAEGTDDTIIFLFDDGEVVEATAKEWRDALWEQNWAVSGFGTVFDQKEKGIIPTILETWYATRKRYQKLMVDAKNANKTDKAAYYDRLQYVYKIKLNSFYGALTNAYFRFYDLRMGESTTGTGRAILLHQCAESVNVITGEYVLPDRVCVKMETGPRKGEYIPATQTDLDDQDIAIHYGYSDKYPIIYGDTDSTYFATRITSSIKDATEYADKIGELVNASFPEYMKNTFLCQPGYDQIIKTGREIVSDRGIFVDKKRYILHIVNDDGFPVDKIKVMGLDTKKTTMPKPIANKLNKFVERLLLGESWDTITPDVVDFKQSLYDVTEENFMDIGLPKGVKKIEKYTDDYNTNTTCFLPGHVSAALHFNNQINDRKDTETIAIHSGDKIKVFYLNQPLGRFKAIAIPVDIEQIPPWFLDTIVPNIDKDAHVLRLVDKPLNNIIKAVGLTTPSKQSLFADSLFEF